MKPNVIKIEELLEKHFNGNKAAFAKAIGVERSQVSALINHGDRVGAKFYGGLIVYCDTHGLDFRNYIFLPLHVKILDNVLIKS
ncbi:hypothetical protein JOC70_000334 [Clostridium pascui]|uniref:hypothetical protein n=1 Tax=Clostridium pascui TaxID=46609 RepID=UPI0019566EAA|nr:hypothetical protein [Clostridium pascui]MBM7868865.1 hypothetical protein [Clostridium pascui]